MDDFANGRNSTPLPSSMDSFDWNTKVKDLLPEYWQLHDEWASEKVDLIDLLGHRTGMPRCGTLAVCSKRRLTKHAIPKTRRVLQSSNVGAGYHSALEIPAKLSGTQARIFV